MKLDKKEQIISDAFTQIAVDDTYLATRVRARMNTHKPATQRRKWKFAVTAMAMMVLTFVTAYAAVELGVFERFIANRNPGFAEIIEPVLVYAEDQGIRIEVIAARQFGRDAVIYLSMQDISGQNRLTPSSWKCSEDHIVSGMTTGLGFDAETNTVYFEMIMRQPHPGPIQLSFDTVVLSDGAFLVEPFPVQPGEMTKPETIYFPTMLHSRDFILTPQRAGNFMPLPDGLNDTPQWISNIGIIDNHLHVQLAGMLDGTKNMTTATVRLVAPDGEYITHDVINESFTLDANFDNPLKHGQTPYYGVYIPHYSFVETIFPIDTTNVENYILMLRVYYRDNITGHWVLEVDTTDSQDEIYVWEGMVQAGDFVIREMLISPLVVRLTGAFENREPGDPLPSIKIQTADGERPIGIISLSFYPATSTFELVSHANAPIDVALITAIIVDDVKIPIN